MTAGDKESALSVPAGAVEVRRGFARAREDASPAGQARYRKRQALVEPVFGILKEQRGMRRFRLRGLEKVSVETTLACMAFNLTRLWRMKNHPTTVN